VQKSQHSKVADHNIWHHDLYQYMYINSLQQAKYHQHTEVALRSLTMSAAPSMQGDSTSRYSSLYTQTLLCDHMTSAVMIEQPVLDRRKYRGFTIKARLVSRSVERNGEVLRALPLLPLVHIPRIHQSTT